MSSEIIFNTEKPFTEEELRDFRAFKIELKSMLKKGKLKVVEKFKVFTFTIAGFSTDEKNKITTFLKKEPLKVKIIT